MIIYKITCKVNNKVYIGQTCEDINKRFRRHMGYQSLEHDTKFYRAVRKYGKENFYIEQIDSADTQEELDDKEIYWINYYDSAQNGYNTRTSKSKCGGERPHEYKGYYLEFYEDYEKRQSTIES